MNSRQEHTVMAEVGDVKEFWNSNPVAAAAIPHELGSKEYFEYYNKLREQNESIEFSYDLHEFRNFKNKNVLDVGCGNGYVLSKFAKEGASVFGVDITDASVDLCNKRFGFLGLDGDFRVGNAEKLPYEDNKFDCVTSMGVLHHTPDTAGAVAEIHRVLKPGGRFIIMLYNRESFAYRVRMKKESKASGKTMQQLVNEVDGLENPLGDVYSRSEMKTLLRDFEITEMFAGLVRMQDMDRNKYNPFVYRYMKMLEKKRGWFLYAKANNK